MGKDGGWRVKASFGGNELFNLKMKVGDKVKGQTRNNIQFGTDESHFGSKNTTTKISVGGMFTFGVGGLLATTRLKLFSDFALETFTAATVAGAHVGADLRFANGDCTGFVGASYGLPSSIPVITNAHVGTV